MLQLSHVKSQQERLGKYKTNLREEILSPLVDALVFIGYATNDMNQFRQDI